MKDDASTDHRSLDHQTDGDANDILVAYRHDAHKLTGESHAHAPKTVAGVPVNQSVPHGADGDAAMLSRPPGDPEQTIPTHETRARRSLITGDVVGDGDAYSHSRFEADVEDLLTTDSPTEMHRSWLASDVAGRITESMYYPYTSLKYHTLLVAALLISYRQGYSFDELRLVVDPADAVESHKTVYTCDRFSLRLDTTADDRPSASLGPHPSRSWAATWQRLSAHPLSVGHDQYDRVLDANLRRIRAWSTALQYIEDFEHWRETL